MKTNFRLTLFIILLSIGYSFSQTSVLSNSDALPDYESKEQPFKISGTLYMSDGVTPANDYIITINQANENGDFEVDENNVLITSASVKTNPKGEYTFYTYIPGNDRLYNKLQEIFMKVQTPDGTEYAMPTLLFDTDPMLTKRCRKQIAKKSDVSRILKLKKEEGISVVHRDMTLTLDLERIN